MQEAAINSLPCSLTKVHYYCGLICPWQPGVHDGGRGGGKVSCTPVGNLLFRMCAMIKDGQWMKVANCISASHLPKSRILLRLTVAFCDFTVPSQPKCATG